MRRAYNDDFRETESDKMGKKADIRECIRSCEKYYETPTSYLRKTGKGFGLTVIMTPVCSVRIGLFPHDEGIRIRAYYGIDCPYDAVDRLLPVLNRINGSLVRGDFVLDSDRTLVFRNFYPVEDVKSFDRDAFVREVNICVKTFYSNLNEIMPIVAGPDPDDDGDTYVIEVV